MTDFNITSKELATALGIKEKKLDSICVFFDDDPNDDWELIQDFHYKLGIHKARIFSYEGALEICSYLEAEGEKESFFKQFKSRLEEWFTGRKRRLKGLCIAKQIEKFNTLDGELIFHNSKPFLSPRACRSLLGLGTRQDVLKRTFEEIQTNSNTEIEILKIGFDFYDNEPERVCEPRKKNYYFSGSGLSSIGKQLGVKLTKRYRQDYVKIVSEYAPKALMAIEKQEQEKENKIKEVMMTVRRKARGRCQITNKKQNIHHFDLEVHHLYDRKTYPKYADLEINLIAISGIIHADFHKWMGGSKVSCKASDMEKYIEQFGDSLFEDDIDQAIKVGTILSKAIQVLEKEYIG
jgi:hypothetical protein